MQTFQKPVSSQQQQETNVFLVDDESDTLGILKKLLDSAGYSTYGFVNPVAALEHFKLNPRGYQVVLTDVRMPEMNGFQLSRQIKSINPDVKIILMTGFEINFDEIKKVIPSVKIDGLIKKPISLEKFRTVIESLEIRHAPVGV
jgi:DNA-binding NtrC family response regulator